MVARKQQPRGGVADPIGEAVQAIRAVQSNLQANVDSVRKVVDSRVQECRGNLERRQLRMRYGVPGDRVILKSGRFAAVIPGDSVAEQVISMGINNFLNLYNAALIGRLILTWFPNPPQVIMGPLATICDPYLNLFRGIIPPLGGTIDLSPILAFIVLDLFSNAMGALPCELGPDGRTPVMQKQRQFRMLNPTPAMEAWARRAEATKQRKQQQQPEEGSQP